MISAKGIIFDYGGTIDTNGIHWGEVIWAQYQLAQVNISKELFREAYVYGERTLAKKPIIQPTHTFHDLLEIKIKIQFDYLHSQGLQSVNNKKANIITEGCYSQVLETIKTTCNVVEEISKNRPTVLVTNFYGNMPVVLKEFSLDKYFDTIVESSVVGIRKPDPRLFALGVKAIGLPAEDIVIIGDSYRKDIAPARSLGCKAVWLKKICWEEESIEAGKEPTAIINNLKQLSEIIL
ncbi:MAG: HAD family hydrolase [Bacteroidales bacterium]|nr:HAD family hydrolase [Bacteroidales bacterium]